MQEATMSISPDLLAILACPKCKGKLAYRPGKPSLDCGVCALSYPVREDIPVMLIDEAEQLEPVSAGNTESGIRLQEP
jgi:uncharacterized protein YbaR (Trm112 family)